MERVKTGLVRLDDHILRAATGNTGNMTTIEQIDANKRLLEALSDPQASYVVARVDGSRRYVQQFSFGTKRHSISYVRAILGYVPRREN